MNKRQAKKILIDGCYRPPNGYYHLRKILDRKYHIWRKQIEKIVGYNSRNKRKRHIWCVKRCRAFLKHATYKRMTLTKEDL